MLRTAAVTVTAIHRPLLARLGGALLLLCAALGFSTTASTAFAADEDPPARIGRLSDAAGTVYQVADDAEGDWQPVGLNYPVTTGDNVWVAEDGRAEIDFGAGQIRLSGNTNVHFSQLDDRQFSAYIASGAAILRLRALEPGEVARFDAANVQLDIRRPGNYRIDTESDGLYTAVVVREGELELRVGDRTMMVYGGQSAVINGTGPGAAAVVRDGVGTDGFDAWSTDRDRRLEGGGLAARYVSTFVPGVRDLDEYGSWDNYPGYGAIWYPRAVGPEWVPYREGRWTYVRPWGWTWVDAAPWGWVPFHYGRWVFAGNRWGWCPGEYVRRPVYAPALVAWYGGSGGTSWSASFAGGPALGWVPLGWGEPYWPSYGFTPGYWRTINRPYAVNVQRVPVRPIPNYNFANARIAGAVTAVPVDVFTHRRPIDGNHYRVPQGALTGAAIPTGPIAFKPVLRPPRTEPLPHRAPPPVNNFIGRVPVPRERIEPRAPEGRPGGAIVPPAQIGGQHATPQAPLPSPQPMPGPSSNFGRPGPGTQPSFNRPFGNEPPPSRQPMVREPAPPAAQMPMPQPQSMPQPRPQPQAMPQPQPMPQPQSMPSPQPMPSQQLLQSPQSMPSLQQPPAPQHMAPRPMLREPMNQGGAPSASPPQPQRIAPPAAREPAPMQQPAMMAPPPRPAAPVVREVPPVAVQPMQQPMQQMQQGPQGRQGPPQGPPPGQQRPQQQGEPPSPGNPPGTR